MFSNYNTAHLDRYIFIRKSGIGIKSCDWFFCNCYLSNGETFLWFAVQNKQIFSYYQPGVYILTLFLPHPSTPAPAVGIRSLRISRWTGRIWGAFGKGGCQAMLNCVLVLWFCLSVCPLASALWFVLFFFCSVLCLTSTTAMLSQSTSW